MISEPSQLLNRKSERIPRRKRRSKRAIHKKTEFHTVEDSPQLAAGSFKKCLSMNVVFAVLLAANAVLAAVSLPSWNDATAKKAIVAFLEHIGRRPILAFGNSDGDLQMLQWVAAGSGARFLGLVHHTDAEREWAYDRQSGIGRLDKALDEAKAKDWTVVNMKDDWKRVFPK